MLKEYPSLLSREESTALKGLLILLVVLGHNSLVMAKTGWFSYLYSFHVYCFYILPFVYGADVAAIKRTGLWQRVWTNVKKFYPLYCFWCLISCGVAVATHRLSFDVRGFVYAVLWGNQLLLFQYCGFGFLWFLPTIVAVMFWRDLFFLLSTRGKIVLWVISMMGWGLAIGGVTNYYALGNYIPFALIPGLFFSASGIMARWNLEHFTDSSMTKIVAIPLFCLVPGYIYCRQYLPAGCFWLSWLFPPIVAFWCFYQFRHYFCRISLLLVAGKYSLQIYLLHTVFFNILKRILQSHNIYIGILIYFLTLILCAVAIIVINKTKFIRKIIFP